MVPPLSDLSTRQCQPSINDASPPHSTTYTARPAIAWARMCASAVAGEMGAPRAQGDRHWCRSVVIIAMCLHPSKADQRCRTTAGAIEVCGTSAGGTTMYCSGSEGTRDPKVAPGRAVGCGQAGFCAAGCSGDQLLSLSHVVQLSLSRIITLVTHRYRARARVTHTAMRG